LLISMNRLFSRSCESLSQRPPTSERNSNATHLKPSLPELLVAGDFRDGSSLKAI
jgi:hypothetical protein